MKKILLSFALVLLFAATVWACPMCKEVASNQSDPATGHRMFSGFAASLYLLLTTPYLLFGGITYFVVRSARRKKKENETRPAL